MLWLKDKIKWDKLPLPDKLELIRKHHCTGPCGQSSSVLITRNAIHSALIEAINQLVAFEQLKEATHELD